ncbi:hypothetical protein CEK28_10620 [Xenophilus sp. AP218F]|nr:hypothetical protein CEK28_10620 [Xenophilus sp. AP218F]
MQTTIEQAGTALEIAIRKKINLSFERSSKGEVVVAEFSDDAEPIIELLGDAPLDVTVRVIHQAAQVLETLNEA